LLGFGYVKPVKGKNACMWYIHDKDGVKRFLNLINGNLYTPYKLEQISKYGSERLTINKLNINLNTTLSSKLINEGWWLCGFTKADGSFVIQIPEKRNQVRLLFKFGNSQKDKVTLNALFLYFGGTVFERLHRNGLVSFYGSSPYSLRGMFSVYCYFNNYLLQSGKYTDFLIWRQCYMIILKNYHITPFLIWCQCYMIILENYHITPLGRKLCLDLRDKLKKLRSNSPL